jgi:hypothetical protein
MKPVTIHTLVVAVTLALSGTTSMAAQLAGQPLSQSEKQTTSATETSPAPLFALSGLDAQTLAEQAMTDHELKAVEGEGVFDFVLSLAASSGSSEYITFKMSEVFITSY